MRYNCLAKWATCLLAITLQTTSAGIIVSNGFEYGESWAIVTGAQNISGESGLYTNETPNNARIRSGAFSWQSCNGSNTLEFAPINIGLSTSRKVVVHVSSISTNSSNGADVADLVRIFVSIDNASFSATPDVELHGWNNARWNYDATNVIFTTAGTLSSNVAPQGATSDNNYALILIGIPDGAHSAAVKIIAQNNLPQEIWCIDDVWIATGDLPPPPPPQIIQQPTSAMAALGSSATFQVMATGSHPLRYQWQKNNSPIFGATNAMLAVSNVQWADAGSIYSVIVSNAIGSVNSSATFLGILAQCSLGTPAAPVTDPEAIVQQPGKNNLVVVTHGWLWAFAPTPYPWLTNMTTAIAGRVSGDWQVVALDWSPDAYTVGTDWVPDVDSVESSQWLPADKAYDRAKNIGSRLGKKLAAQNWQHIHFIAHSAGAALIQQATDVIKSTSSGIEIHETFLDPYPRTDKKGLTWFGSNADWADCYWTANDMNTGKFTDGPLTHAHNVEVSWLDPAKNIISHSRYNYPQLDYVTRVQIAHSTHGYPHDFYVFEPSELCVGDYGFALSKEAETGGWADRANYPVGNGVVAICGEVPEVEYKPLIQHIEPVSFSQFINPIVQPFAQSFSGVNMGAGTFTLSSVGGQSPIQNRAPRSLLDASSSTGTTAWLTVGLNVTSLVNYVQFDAGFNGTNGGFSLLSVYWNTNLIGSVDESVEAGGIHPYHFALPGSFTEGVYSLGFELDSFTNNASSITITNIVLGFQGVDVSITLEAIRPASNGVSAVTLSGASNYVYMLEASTNLLNWKAAVEVINTNASITVPDPESTNFNHRFYRVRFQ